MKTLQELQNDVDRILDEVKSQQGPLKYHALRKIARHQGWKEVKSGGKGDHRWLRRQGYANITVDCPGEGSELNAYVARLKLREVYQPAIHQLIRKFWDSAVEQEIDQRLGEVADLLDGFSADALRVLSQEESVLAIATEAAEDAQQKIAAAMADLELIRADEEKKCVQAAQGLIEGEGRRYREEIKQLSHQLAKSTQNNQVLCQMMQLMAQEADTKQQSYQLASAQFLEDIEGLKENLENAEHRNQKLSRALKGLKRQQRIKEIAALIGIGLAIALGITGLRSLVVVATPTSANSLSETVSFPQ